MLARLRCQYLRSGSGVSASPPGGPTVTAQAVPLGGSAWLNVYLSNSGPVAAPVALEVAGPGYRVVPEATWVPPGTNTATVRVYRTVPSPAVTVLRVVQGDGSIVSESPVWAGPLSWLETATTGTAQHAYPFTQGDVSVLDAIGGLNGTDTTTTLAGMSFGPPEIVGAAGTLTLTDAAARGPVVPNADWVPGRDCTWVMAYSAAANTSVRGIVQGPGTGSGPGATQSLFGLACRMTSGTTYVELQSQTFRGPSTDGVLQLNLPGLPAGELTLVVVRRNGVDATGRPNMIYDIRQTARGYRLRGRYGSATPSYVPGDWYFGGDGATYFRLGCAFHFAHAYGYVLPDAVVDNYAELLGLAEASPG